MALEKMTARKRNDYEDDEEYDWCPTSAFWGSGSNYMITHIPPDKPGFRRPIGFTADIDNPVETWEGSEKPDKKKQSRKELQKNADLLPTETLVKPV